MANSGTFTKPGLVLVCCAVVSTLVICVCGAIYIHDWRRAEHIRDAREKLEREAVARHNAEIREEHRRRTESLAQEAHDAAARQEAARVEALAEAERKRRALAEREERVGKALTEFRLEPGMTRDQARLIMGEPAAKRGDVPNEAWIYVSGKVIQFHGEHLTSFTSH